MLGRGVGAEPQWVRLTDSAGMHWPTEDMQESKRKEMAQTPTGHRSDPEVMKEHIYNKQQSLRKREF